MVYVGRVELVMSVDVRLLKMCLEDRKGRTVQFGSRQMILVHSLRTQSFEILLNIEVCHPKSLRG